MIYYIAFAIAAFLIYQVLKPGVATGGDLDLFISANQGGPRKKASSWRVTNEPGKQVLVLYATAYGFSESVAKKFWTKLRANVPKGVQVRLLNAKHIGTHLDLSKENVIISLCSTAGDGVPPADARDLFELLDSRPNLSHVRFTTLAFGDTNYTHFCRAGKQLDEKFEACGAKRIIDRVDIDRDNMVLIESWCDQVQAYLNANAASIPDNIDYMHLLTDPDDNTGSFNRNNPFTSTMKVKRLITKTGQKDDKEIIHAEFDLTGSNLTYTSGDALGIIPINDPKRVDALCKAMKKNPSEIILDVNFDEFPTREILMKQYDIKSIKVELIQKARELSTSTQEQSQLDDLLAGGMDLTKNKVLAQWLHGREVIDCINTFKCLQSVSIQDMLPLLKPLQPRYYSISSSGIVSPNQPSITASIVRYNTYNQDRIGVCTTYIQDRVQVNQQVSAFISVNPDFRLPKDSNKTIIMVGPGTGIAPFRAFIQERVHMNASGKNILYFGCRTRDRDYTYADELEGWKNQGKLDLKVAFSRETSQKVYVQHLLAQDSQMIYNELQNGAHFYICGDGANMANDVHNVLIKILCDNAKVTPEQAQAYLDMLVKQKRYEKDVWVS